MRILHIAFQRFRHLAGERVVLNFVRWSRRAGLACDLALVDTTRGEAEPPNHEDVPALRFVWNQPYNALQVWRIVSAIRRASYDVLHFHAWGNREYLLKRLLVNHSRVVTHFHGLPKSAAERPAAARQWARRVVRCSHQVVANSAFSGDWLRSLAPSGFPLRLVHNGIDLEEFQPREPGESVRRSWGFPPEALVIGIVARFIPEKAIPEALEAVAPLLRTSDRYRVVVLGDGPEGPRIENWIRDAQLEARVRLLGWRRDVPDCLQAVDLLLHSSHYEGFGMAVLEAMAMARPVVAYAVGGIPELVAHGKNGYLVPRGEKDALRQAVELLASNAELRRRMGEAGRATAQKKFSAQQTAGRLQALYEFLVQPSAAGPPR